MEKRCKECKHLAMCIVTGSHIVGRALWLQMRRERKHYETHVEVRMRFEDVACGARERWGASKPLFDNVDGSKYYVRDHTVVMDW